MYENTNSSIDWKGLFFKVVIAFLIVLIAVTGYKTFKNSNKTNKNNITSQVAETKTSSTFTANIEKLKKAGETYYNNNKDKKPKEEGITSMVTLNELISSGVITSLTDEDGKTCDGESSYVTAILEGKKTKIKANLVCGESSSYSIVYLAENDSETTETKEETTSSSKSTSTKTSTSSSKTSKSSTTCTSSTCTPSVSVSTNTNVSTNVTVNKPSNSNTGSNTTNSSNNTTNNNTTSNQIVSTTRTYKVTFDKNGGTKYYRTQYVNEGNTAYDPGSNYKSGYSFKGWYLNGEKFDFNTPIYNDITLVAKYYDDDYDYDYDYDRNYTGKDTFYTYVYTLGWDTKGTDEMEITHTLRLPEDEIEEIEDDENIEITEIRIKDINFYKSLTTTTQLNTYNRNHEDTFFYTNTGWEKRITKTNNLATIRSSAVDFDYSSRYVDIYDADDDGFEVTWEADDVYRQCSTTFSVNGETNKCGYGIIYKVTWEYKYEY